jgi:hypothetical protein
MILAPAIAAGMAASVCAAVAVCWPLALLNGKPKQRPDKTRHPRSERVEQPKRERPRLSVMRGGRE